MSRGVTARHSDAVPPGRRWLRAPPRPHGAITDGAAADVGHAIELPFVFGTLDTPMIDLFAGAGPDAERLAESVQDAWIAFARTGDPSTVALGTWQPFDAGRRSTMVLEPECGLEEAPRHDKLRCWLPA